MNFAELGRRLRPCFWALRRAHFLQQHLVLGCPDESFAVTTIGLKRFTMASPPTRPTRPRQINKTATLLSSERVRDREQL